MTRKDAYGNTLTTECVVAFSKRTFGKFADKWMTGDFTRVRGTDTLDRQHKEWDVYARQQQSTQQHQKGEEITRWVHVYAPSEFRNNRDEETAKRVLQLAIEAIGEPVIVLDRDGNVVQA